MRALKKETSVTNMVAVGTRRRRSVDTGQKVDERLHSCYKAMLRSRKWEPFPLRIDAGNSPLVIVCDIPKADSNRLEMDPQIAAGTLPQHQHRRLIVQSRAKPNPVVPPPCASRALWRRLSSVVFSSHFLHLSQAIYTLHRHAVSEQHYAMPAMEIEMEYDDVAWERSEEIEEAWKKKVKQYDCYYQLANLVARSRGGNPVEVRPPEGGSFNMVILIIFRDGGKAAVRLAIPGSSMFPEEKTLIEVATIRYIQARTTIPVPLILDSGTQEQCPLGLGPFIVMEWAESSTSLCDALRDPTMPVSERPLLDPNIAENKLRTIYSRMAEVLVQLSVPTEERIGALSQVEEDEWVVDKAPLTLDSSTLVQLGTLPRSKTLSGTFDNSASYFEALADIKIQHLIHQRNDAINGSDDCRRKYVARQLFQKLARENKLAWPTTPSSRPKFRLFNDDFRPTNVLAVTGGKRDFVVSGVVDWEWTYFAPPEFTYSPPWWLLIARPDSWPKGLDDWAVKYEQALPTFLDELRKVEDDYIARSRLEEGDRLSDRMRECWDSGDFWVFYAMQRSFSFDYIFWHKICPRFFGFGADEWREGLEMMGAEQLREMDQLVKRKLDEMKTRELAWDYDGPGPEDFAVEEDKKEDDEPAEAEPKLIVTVSRTEFESLKQEHEKLKREHEKLKAWVEEEIGKLGVKNDPESKA
ncbi:hypothetical protein HDK64DRAFT_298211 [Phyllosticta capitalensis]